jgi:hypothetical protein
MPTRLIFDPVHRSRHQLALNYRLDDIAFSTVYWYDTVDFYELEARFGPAFMRKVYFHLLAFEANQAASLKPTLLDPGPYADLFTDRFAELWGTIFRHVWGVWPHLLGPRPAGRTPAAVILPPQGAGKLLMLCGGGKDSLATAKLLEGAGIPYEAMVYSHSIYGKAQRQHDLIDGMLAHTRAGRVHRGWVYDTALDSPAARLHPEYGVKRMLSAETVSSYWTALPIALQHGFERVALGITRSTDEHNFTWEKTGEEINYLWGMSVRAEKLLHDYIRAEIAENLSFFHLLRPVYDLVVFALLARDQTAVTSTHSCAQQKPWCCRCPKCIYVWMHLVAYLDEWVVAQMFKENLFDLPENRIFIRKMLGIEGYKPWDCMGTVSETQVAFLLCRAKGVSGRTVADISPSDIPLDIDSFLARYAAVQPPEGAIPPDLYERLQPQFLAGAERARAAIGRLR